MTRSMEADALMAQPSGERCPLCAGTTFGDYRGRPRARCVACGAKERERLLALAIERAQLDAQGCPIYHFAPESGISRLLRRRFKEMYCAADFNPDDYIKLGCPVQKVDLQEPATTFAPRSVGGFVHAHVLEHVPGSLDRVVNDLNAAIVPGGFHVFQVPIHVGYYREDMDPRLSPDDRRDRFFQEDHLRVFGTEDFAERVLSLFDGFKLTRLADLLTQNDLMAAAVPVSALHQLTGHSPFIFTKMR